MYVSVSRTITGISTSSIMMMIMMVIMIIITIVFFLHLCHVLSCFSYDIVFPHNDRINGTWDNNDVNDDDKDADIKNTIGDGGSTAL